MLQVTLIAFTQSNQFGENDDNKRRFQSNIFSILLTPSPYAGPPGGAPGSDSGPKHKPGSPHQIPRGGGWWMPSVLGSIRYMPWTFLSWL
jgi:hypothetical protein